MASAGTGSGGTITGSLTGWGGAGGRAPFAALGGGGGAGRTTGAALPPHPLAARVSANMTEAADRIFIRILLRCPVSRAVYFDQSGW
jgi:hypothetical protein